MYGFKGMGWFASGLAVALGGYMVMQQGASERARLTGLERRIADARKDIRNLETEFSTRANLAQLERWNGEAVGMAAPAPQQFAQGEIALANLDRQPEPEAKIQQAAVVPSAAPRAEPAVAIAAANPSATAHNANPSGADGARPSNRAVAMVDPGQLLSASTIGDLDRDAVSERKRMQ